MLFLWHARSTLPGRLRAGFLGWHLPSTARALAVQGTEHLRGKQRWGCLERDCRKILLEGTLNFSSCAKTSQWDVKVGDSLEGSLCPKDHGKRSTKKLRSKSWSAFWWLVELGRDAECEIARKLPLLQWLEGETVAAVCWLLLAHLPLSPLELQVTTPSLLFQRVFFFAGGFLNVAGGFAAAGFYFCLRKKKCLFVGSVIYQSPCQVHCSRSRHIKPRAWTGMLQAPANHRGPCLVLVLQSCLLRPCSDLLSHKCHCRRSRTSLSSSGSFVALTLCCSLSREA